MDRVIELYVNHNSINGIMAVSHTREATVGDGLDILRRAIQFCNIRPNKDRQDMLDAIKLLEADIRKMRL
jgi:hypothetical protein